MGPNALDQSLESEHFFGEGGGEGKGEKGLLLGYKLGGGG